jgi:hypothetical protein
LEPNFVCAYAVGNDRIAVIADKPYFDQLTTAAFLRLL